MQKWKLAFWIAAGLFILSHIKEQSFSQGFFLPSISDPRIQESSGLKASRRYPGVLWTHGDEGSNPKLFAINRVGRTLGSFQIIGEKMEDWEEIVLDHTGNMYLADTGNNLYQRRRFGLHKIKEPYPRGAGVVEIEQSWKVNAPRDPLDAEGVFIHRGYCYLIGKASDLGSSRSPVYRFSLMSEKPILSLLGYLNIQGQVGGADLSLDQQRLAILTNNGIHLYRIQNNPLSLFYSRPHYFPLISQHTEGVTFAGNGIIVSSELGELFLIKHPLLNGW